MSIRLQALFFRLVTAVRNRPYLWVAAMAMLGVLILGWGTAYFLHSHAITSTTELAVIVIFAAFLSWLARCMVYVCLRRREEARLYRKVIESLPDSLNLKDASGRFIIANEATADLMNASSAADLIGKTDFDFYPREVAEHFLLDEREVMAKGVPRVLEQVAILKDGKRVTLSTLKVPVRDAKGALIGLITHNRDISALKDDLEHSEAKYRLLWENSSTANFLALPPNFTIEQGNEAVVRLFGARDRSQLEALRLADLSPEMQDDGQISAERERRLIDDALRDGSATSEWLFSSLDGRKVYSEVKFNRVNSNGRIGLQCSVTDITDRVLLSRHQADARRLLAEEVNTRTAELEEATYELHLAQSVGSMGSFSADLASDSFSCSPETARILDLQEFDNIATAEWSARIHPGDRQAVSEAWKKAIEDGAPYDITYRILVPAGVRHVKSGARFKRDSTGRAVSAIGALLDLTSLLANREESVLKVHRARVDGLLAATAAIQADVDQNTNTDPRELADRLLRQFPNWSAEEINAVIQEAIATIKDRRR